MLTRTDGFRDFDRFVQQVTGTASRPAAMPFDAYRQGEQFTMQFDIPGIDPSSIDLTIEKNVLTVRAERRRIAGDDIETLVRERATGVFARRISLGDSLDADRLEANYTDGVLTLTVPVAEKAKPRKVDVTLGKSTMTEITTEAKPADELVGAN